MADYSKLLGQILGTGAALHQGKGTIDSLNEDEKLDALSKGLTSGSGAASTVGSASALPLAAGALGIAGGKSAGEQQANYGVDEMGNSFSDVDENLRPDAPKATMGPLRDPNKFDPVYGAGVDLFAPLPQPEQLPEEPSAPTTQSNPLPSQPSTLDAEKKMFEAGFSNDTVANLQAEQDKTNEAKRLQNILSAFKQIGAGVAQAKSNSEIKADTSFNEMMKKQADDVS